MVESGYEHIILDEKNVPLIKGTSMKVSELVLEHIAYDWGAEDLKYHHQFLTLGQIHSALAYYWDHQEELDSDIVKSLRVGDQQVVDQLRRIAKPPSLWERLRAEGVI